MKKFIMVLVLGLLAFSVVAEEKETEYNESKIYFYIEDEIDNVITFTNLKKCYIDNIINNCPDGWTILCFCSSSVTIQISEKCSICLDPDIYQKIDNPNN